MDDMSTARRLIEQGHGPDDVRGKDYTRDLFKRVELKLSLEMDQPIAIGDMDELIAAVSDALEARIMNVGLAPGEASVIDMTVSPISPPHGQPAGWNLGE